MATLALTTLAVAPTPPPLNGEDLCEGHGYDAEQCEAVGCCQFAFCPANDGTGECHSNVGAGACASVAFDTHVEALDSCQQATCENWCSLYSYDINVGFCNSHPEYCGGCSMCTLTAASLYSSNGEDLCEGHGYDAEQCEAVGCCQFAFCPANDGTGECHSNVGAGACASVAFDTHVEAGAWCAPSPSLSPPSLNNVHAEFFGGNVDCGTVPSYAEQGLAVTVGGHATSHAVDISRLELGGDTTVNNPVLHGYQTGSNFIAVLSAAVPIRSAGAYTFSLELGDADTARLTVNGAEVLRTPCAWGGTYEATAALAAGVHAVRLVFVDDGWYDKARLRMAGPDTGGALAAVPTAALTEATWGPTSPPPPALTPPLAVAYEDSSCEGGDQGSNLGPFGAASECQPAAAAQEASAPGTCKMFMFSESYPSWGCRCCLAASQSHHFWTIYTVGEATQSSNPDGFDPCAGKAEGAMCRLCDPVNPDCVETDEVKECRRVSSQPEQGSSLMCVSSTGDMVDERSSRPTNDSPAASPAPVDDADFELLVVDPSVPPALSTPPPLNGEDLCEGHGYDAEQCEAVGCCQFAFCPANDGTGECHSNVGAGACASVAFDTHVEAGAWCAPSMQLVMAGAVAVAMALVLGGAVLRLMLYRKLVKPKAAKPKTVVCAVVSAPEAKIVAPVLEAKAVAGVLQSPTPDESKLDPPPSYSM